MRRAYHGHSAADEAAEQPGQVQEPCGQAQPLGPGQVVRATCTLQRMQLVPQTLAHVEMKLFGTPCEASVPLRRARSAGEGTRTDPVMETSLVGRG